MIPTDYSNIVTTPEELCDVSKDSNTSNGVVYKTSNFIYQVKFNENKDTSIAYLYQPSDIKSSI